MHNRRARPTLRLLREDLVSGWDSPYPLRQLASGSYEALHPLSELPHPIIAKAAESFGPDPSDDLILGVISSSKLRLMEVKIAQWRGGVWEDPDTGVRWLVVAGLAKGQHQDREDFYMCVQRENQYGSPARWLPTMEDKRLLERETAARLITEWELEVQARILDALGSVHAGGSTRVEIVHPVAELGRLAVLTLEVTPVREPRYEADEIEVEITPLAGHAGSNLVWQLTTRVLVSLSPPEQGWDRYKNLFANIAEPGGWTKRTAELEALVVDNELAVPEPGRCSHYTHRRHLAGSTIEGRAVRALCGVFFVPTRDHHDLDPCPSCQERLRELPT